MKKLSKVLNESIWGKVLDRGAGETVRKEDKITTNKELKNKIQKLYKEQGEGETLDVSSLTNIIKCDDFSGIFEGYKRVKYIIGLEDWDVSHVKDMRSMFCDCKKFNSDLSKWDVSNVKDMRFMFQNCKKFNSDLSKWDVSNVEDMSFMFVNCGDFNYDLSNWDVSKVTDMKFMFQNCENFNSDLSKWDVSKVINMSYMFLYCINFNSDLSKWNVSKVTDMKYMFDDCKSLKKIPSWYMKRQSKITESIWGKILDRGAGDTVRKEDDITNIKSLIPVDMGGSVLWADNDLSLKDGDCYFSFDEVFELIKDSGWRLPTLEEVAELDKIYEKGSFWGNEDRFVFDGYPHQLVFFKKGLVYTKASDEPTDKDYYYCWTSTLLKTNNNFAHILTFDNDHPIHTPLNCNNINDTVLQDTNTGKLCVRLVKDK